MKAVFIRHAPSDANESRMFAGTSDVPLSQRGMIEAKALAETLGRARYQRYFSSPLIRARHTAEFLFPDQNFATDERLIERCLGEWEGRQVDEMRVRHPHAFLPSGKMQPLFTPPLGESIQSVAERIIQFIRCNLDENVDSLVAITHNSVIRTLRSLAEAIPLDDVFSSSEDKLQPRSYDINEELMRIMEERRKAFFSIAERR